MVNGQSPLAKGEGPVVAPKGLWVYFFFPFMRREQNAGETGSFGTK